MIWIILAVVGVAEVAALTDYRLPGDVRPSHYILEVVTELGPTNYQFYGEVWIKVECIEPTNKIILHAKELTIKGETTVREVLNKMELLPLSVGSVDLVKQKDFLVINLNDILTKGSTYIIHLAFSGPLNKDLTGYYRSSYFDNETSTTKWLAVTHFKSTAPRKAFPCFDEPEMKAKFTVRLAHHEKLKAISNMPLIKNLPYKGEGLKNYVWSQFEESVPMSTYLVDYIICDFEFKETLQLDNNITFRIWSRKDALLQTDFAAEVGPKMLEYYETYFDVKYPLPKQDMVAIPDFSASAMESWGLMSFRETTLLFDDKVSSKLSQHGIAYTIAHELAHQWFGNLVTMKWWTELWLNEGLATYVAILGVEKMFPDWGYLNETILDFAIHAFDLDSLLSSHEVSKEIVNTNEISQLYVTIYKKKSSMILRMLHHCLGDSFRKGLSKYLQKHSYGNAEQDDLCAALTEQAREDKTLNISVKSFMDTWTLQTGYPLITVHRDYTKGTAKFKQSRYFQVKPARTLDNTCWWVPITYMTQNQQEEVWMSCKNKDVMITNLDANSWLLLNVNIEGLYRVQYDSQNWELLIKALRSDKIPVMNRADIIMTGFDLAWIGQLPYSTAFDLVCTLEKETEWLPWKVGLIKLEALKPMFSRTPGYLYFKDYLIKLLTPIYTKQYNKLTEIPERHDKLKLHTAISRWAVELELGDSLSQAQSLFTKWMKAKDPDYNNPIHQDLRSIIYCNSVSFGGTHIWEFLLNRYKNSNVGTEKNTILSALACSRNVWILKRYLEWSIDENSILRRQDSAHVFSAIAGQNIGYYVACEFLQRRIKYIYKYHSGKSNKLEIRNYLESCSDRIISEDELNKWKEFIGANQEYLKEAQLAANQSIEKALSNTKWFNKNYKNLYKIIKSYI